MTTPWFYPDKISAQPGEDVSLFASSPLSPCSLVVRRIGKDTVEVARYDAIDVEDAATPTDADQNGCGWPEAFRFTVGDDWKTGYYDLELSDPNGAKSHHYLCVRKSDNAPKAQAAIILSTNTYNAYNYWGGSNSYANVTELMAGKVTPDESRLGAIGRLSRMRPFPQLMLAPPPDAPRLVNLEIREPGEPALPGDIDWNVRHRPSPYDGSAGFMYKWEHAFAAWAETSGYELDYMTDHDFESNALNLVDYKAVLAVGHSEYWSGNQRRSLDKYVDDGGNLAVFSGNTGYWKVRWENNEQTLIAHKWRGEKDDPLWDDPNTRADATHLWSHEAFEKPEAALIGLSFLYGGYHRLCMCVARGSGGYTVYNDKHWSLEDADLFYGDQIGAGLPLLGYENDGCPIQFDQHGLPISVGGLGVPPNLEIIAFAPATLAESPDNPHTPRIPREDPEVLARLAYGREDDETVERLMRGHAVMASFKRGKGEVFNAGTTEWVHGLDAKDPFVEKITANVLKRFGVNPNLTDDVI